MMELAELLTLMKQHPLPAVETRNFKQAVLHRLLQDFLMLGCRLPRQRTVFDALYRAALLYITHRDL